MSLDESVRFRAEKFANARACAGQWSIYRNGEFLNGYRPRLAGQWISLGENEPEIYFKSEAIKAAQTFKQECRKLLMSGVK